MRLSAKSSRQQAGAALLIMLLSLLLATSYLWYRSANAANPSPMQHSVDLNNRLLRAKEALIARAVTDANRPGSLPCPDLLTDDNGLSNHPNDGKSDNLTRNDCPSYIGWLPWVTLDLPELTDDSGNHLWYVLARPLRDDDLAQPINSDTTTPLMLDGRSDIAALIIAAGAAVNGQNRPTNTPSDYLEGENTNGDTLFVSGPGNAAFNDVVLALTRQELMSAVEKRVAGEVRACLEQHASAATNSRQDYPWPAPFSSSNARGKAGSYFGQVASSQPGPGPQALLAASNTDLQNAKIQLSASSSPEAQMTALISLNDNLLYAKTFYDRLYSTAKDLALSAKSNALNFSGLDSTLLSANSNGRISVTERKTIQSDSGSAQSPLAALQNALIDSGIDVFPDELASRNLTLQSSIDLAVNTPNSSNLDQLKIASEDQLSLFSNSHTSNNDLSSKLATALSLSANAVLTAQNAAAAPSDNALLNTALSTARSLKTANEHLQSSITANRTALHPSEISTRTSQLSGALLSFTQTPDSIGSNTLAQMLKETQLLISGINTTSSTLLPLRSNTLNALNQAITASNSANNWPLISSSTQEAIIQSNTLSQAMSNHGDNLTQESLAASSNQFNSQLSTFNTIVTHTQAEMVPYAENLRLAAVDVRFWAEIIDRQASSIATLARKSPEASKTQSNAASSYSLAEQTLTSINKSTGTLKKLQDYLDDPSKSSKQSAAKTAISDTLGLLDTLLLSTGALGQNLHSNPAEAFPTLWYGSRCAFLQPGTDNTSWWLANQWANSTFFQISSRTRSSEGRLQVNGSGNYRSVAISAGQAIGTQERGSKRSANYFENLNADTSRDADATSPSPYFISRPTTPEFNDRLAY